MVFFEECFYEKSNIHRFINWLYPTSIQLFFKKQEPQTKEIINVKFEIIPKSVWEGERERELYFL